MFFKINKHGFIEFTERPMPIAACFRLSSGHSA